MRLFRPDVELTLKTIGIIVLVGLIVLPMGWGYEQRHQARTWRRVACAYRVKEVARDAGFLIGLDVRDDPCAALQRLGVALETPR